MPKKRDLTPKTTDPVKRPKAASARFSPDEQAQIEAFLANPGKVTRDKPGEYIGGSGRPLPRRRWWSQPGMAGAGQAHQKLGSQPG